MRKHEFYRKEFDWAEESYDVIQAKMGLPDWFGKNTDALWDMLTGFIETPCEIKFIDFDKKEKEYNENQINLILKCFIDAMQAYPDNFFIIFED